MSRWYLVVGEAIFILGVCFGIFAMFRQNPPVPGAVHVDVKLPDSRADVYLHRDEAGHVEYLLREPGGNVEKLSPDQLAQQIASAGNQGWLARAGGSSPAVLLWLGIGFFGQVLFTGRMVVQWLASERKGKSVVPAAFWWMSLGGSLLLLAYFMWRRDPIGLLGQTFGSFIYLRNILWILEGKKLTPAEKTSEEVES